METEAGNKIIALFIGKKIYYRNGQIAMVQHGNGNSDSVLKDWAQYHSSWDWLMGVVEKIEEIQKSGMAIINNSAVMVGFSATGKSKIEAVWKCVILFIQWYNQNAPRINTEVGEARKGESKGNGQ